MSELVFTDGKELLDVKVYDWLMKVKSNFEEFGNFVDKNFNLPLEIATVYGKPYVVIGKCDGVTYDVDGSLPTFNLPMYLLKSEIFNYVKCLVPKLVVNGNVVHGDMVSLGIRFFHKPGLWSGVELASLIFRELKNDRNLLLFNIESLIKEKTGVWYIALPIREIGFSVALDEKPVEYETFRDYCKVLSDLYKARYKHYAIVDDACSAICGSAYIILKFSESLKNNASNADKMYHRLSLLQLYP